MSSVPERVVFKLNPAPFLKWELCSIYSGFGARTLVYLWRTMIGRFLLPSATHMVDSSNAHRGAETCWGYIMLLKSPKMSCRWSVGRGHTLQSILVSKHEALFSFSPHRWLPSKLQERQFVRTLLVFCYWSSSKYVAVAPHFSVLIWGWIAKITPRPTRHYRFDSSSVLFNVGCKFYRISWLPTSSKLFVYVWKYWHPVLIKSVSNVWGPTWKNNHIGIK